MWFIIHTLIWWNGKPQNTIRKLWYLLLQFPWFNERKTCHIMHTYKQTQRESECKKTVRQMCKEHNWGKMATAKNSNEMMIVAASTTRTGNVDRKKSIKRTASIMIIKNENYWSWKHRLIFFPLYLHGQATIADSTSGSLLNSGGRLLFDWSVVHAFVHIHLV